MNHNMIKKISSSFLSCEKDLEKILKILFFENGRYSDTLKRLLVVTNKDCLDSHAYDDTIARISLSDLVNSGFVRDQPTLDLDDTVKTYMIITFGDFTPNQENPMFRDCTITIDIMCHKTTWSLDNFAVRPIKIMGYIDGLLNNTRLSGIGTLKFISASMMVLDENLRGYTVSYSAIHETTNGDDLEEVE